MNKEEILENDVLKLISSPKEFHEIHDYYCKNYNVVVIDSIEFINYLLDLVKERQLSDSYKLNEQLHQDIICKEVIYELLSNDSTSSNVLIEINDTVDDIIASETNLVSKKRKLTALIDKCSDSNTGKEKKKKRAIQETNK